MRGLLGRINKNPKIKPKNQDDASRQNTKEKTNEDTKNTMAPDNTELTIQIIFAAAVVAAHLLSFYTLHIEALTLLFKCLTNKEQRGQTPLHSKTSKSERRLRGWKRRKKKSKYSWKYTKCMAKLVLTTLVAMDLADNIAKHSDPDNPIHNSNRN